MSVSLLPRLTLVMPTLNRRAYALRSMRYWSGRGVVVHVLDGSPQPICVAELENLGQNICYHHLPFSFVERLKESLAYIETDYVALCGDDEFYIPSGLNSCISELQHDSTLVSCMGRCLKFDFKQAEVVAWADYLAMENYAVLGDDPVERMVSHMNPYTCSTIYSVVRTPVWKRAFSTFIQKEFSAYAIGELQIELAICYQGKSKVIPELTWLRSAEAEPTRGTDPSLVPEKTFTNWWKSPEMEFERAEFLRIMGITLADSEEQVVAIAAGGKRALDVYTQTYSDTSTELLSTGVLSAFSAKVRQHLPEQVKRIVKLVLRPFVKAFSLGVMPVMAAARNLANTGVTVDMDELSKIHKIVNAFHVERAQFL